MSQPVGISIESNQILKVVESKNLRNISPKGIIDAQESAIGEFKESVIELDIIKSADVSKVIDCECGRLTNCSRKDEGLKRATCLAHERLRLAIYVSDDLSKVVNALRNGVAAAGGANRRDTAVRISQEAERSCRVSDNCTDIVNAESLGKRRDREGNEGSIGVTNETEPASVAHDLAKVVDTRRIRWHAMIVPSCARTNPSGSPAFPNVPAIAPPLLIPAAIV